MSDIQNYYDKYWDRKDSATWTPNVARWPEDRFLRAFGILSGKENILDIGCGDGTTYQDQVRAVVGNIQGIDASPDAIGRVIGKGIAASVCKIDSEPFPYPDAIFDGAACIEVFEHLFDPLFTANEAFRVLKPGGVLVTSVPNFGYFGDRMEALLRARVRSCPFDPENCWAGAHIRFFNLRTFTMLLEKAGFRVLRKLPEGRCSIFDLFSSFGKFSPFTEAVRAGIPGIFQLSFLDKLAPALFAQHILLHVEKPRTK